jgi:hypothetical protein
LIFVRVVLFEIVVGSDLLFFWSWVGEQKFTVAAAAEGKLFFADRMIGYQLMVKDISAFAEGTFEESFGHYLPR